MPVNLSVIPAVEWIRKVREYLGEKQRWTFPVSFQQHITHDYSEQHM